MSARIRAATICLLLAALGLAACGRSAERDVRDTLDAFAESVSKKDYQRLCDEVFAERLVEEVERSLPCEVALSRSDLGDARTPKLEIRRIRVDGDQASALVATSAANQPPSEDTVRLVREGDEWRILALASD